MSLMKPVKANTIDEYIFEFPKGTQKILEQIRATIKKSATQAEKKSVMRCQLIR